MALTQISTQGIKDGTITGSDLATNVDLVDNQKLRLGTSNDLQIYHDSFNPIINAGTDTLRIVADNIHLEAGDFGDEMLRCIHDGGVELYFDNSKKFETTSSGVAITGGLTASGNSTFNADVFFVGASSKTITFDQSEGHIRYLDNAKAQFGTQGDLQIFHDGSNSKIVESGTGSLIIQTSNFNLDNADGTENILTATENGAVELYYNGTKTFETAGHGVNITGGFVQTGNSIINDNGKLQFGNGTDLQIYHDGSNSYIKEVGTGNLNIQSDNTVEIEKANGTDIARFHPDGAVELFYNGTKKFETTNGGINITGSVACSGGASNNLSLPDNGKAKFGTGDDLQIYHDGTDSIITNSTGDLQITDTSDDITITAADDIRLRPQGGENGINVLGDGAVELYHNNVKRFETDSNGVRVVAPEGEQAILRLLGDEADDANDSFRLNAGGGTLKIQDASNQSSWEDNIVINSAGSVELYHDNSKKLSTDSNGVKINSSSLYIDSDNEFVAIGAGDDLKITHNGTNSVIENATGALVIKPEGLMRIQDRTTDEFRADFNDNGSVALYYNGNKKFETTSDGVAITTNSSQTTRTSEDTVLIKNTNSGASTCAALLLQAHDASNGIFRISTQKHSSGSGAEFHIDHGTNARMQMSGDNGDIKFGVNGTMINTFTPGNGNSTTGLGIEPRNGTIFASRGDSACIRANVNTNDVNIVSFANNGTVRGRVFMQTTTVSYATSSDYRLKENQVLISDGITRLKTLKPYRFNFIEDPSKTVDGFFAHEVTAVPEAVSGTKDEVDKNGDPVHQGLDYGRITPLLTAALQEAISKIEVLETEVAALKAA